MSILGKNFGSRVSLENREGSDEQTEVRSEVDVRVAETRADVAEDALRRTEEMDQIEEVREQIEGGLEVAEALENFKTNLSGKIATGGLTKGKLNTLLICVPLWKASLATVVLWLLLPSLPKTSVLLLPTKLPLKCL